MTVSATSLAAYDRTDRTAGQKRVLAVLGANREPLTRHEIAAKGRLPLQSVCGRINELVQLGDVTELRDTRDGRHLLTVSQGALGMVRTVGKGTWDSPAPAQANGFTHTGTSLPDGECLEPAPLLTRVIWETEGRRVLVDSPRDPWELCDAARAYMFPDVNPRDYDERFVAAKRIRDAK